MAPSHGTSRPPVPVTILTGFLGAGKTTLLNRILRAGHGLRVGVMVNDFGAVNIDAKLVAGVEGDVVDLSNGCVCCTMRGGLVQQTLKLLSRSNPPDYLLVEASGISDPVGVARAFETSALRERTRLDALIALADAENVRNPRFDQQLIQDQLRSADVIVLNKVDLVDSATRKELQRWVQMLVPRARLLEAVQAQVPLDLLLDLTADGAEQNYAQPWAQVSGENDHDHDHSATFHSWSYTTGRPLAFRRLQDVLSSLSPGVFRAKGIVHVADAPGLRFAVQMVGRRLAVDIAGPWPLEEERRTELVFIGRTGALDQEMLERQLDTCITESAILMSRENMKQVRRVPGVTGASTLGPEKPTSERDIIRTRSAVVGDRSRGTTLRS